MSRAIIELNQFKMDEQEPLAADDAATAVGVGPKGNDIAPTSKHCLAKMVTDPSGGKHYWARVCSSGFQASTLFNPQADHLEMLTQENPTNGRSRYEFRRVSSEAYRMYTEFLRTGNVALLRNAERTK